MTTTFRIGKDATGPSLSERLQYDDGSPIDLTAGSVRFQLYDAAGAQLIDRAATIVTPLTGTVRFDWLVADTAVGGTFFRRWRVTLASGQVMFVPTEDGLDSYVVEVVDPAVRSVSGRLVCSAWCAPADVSACPACKGRSFDPSETTDAIDIASDILFFLSGRQFPGICADTVSPNRPEWGGASLGSSSIDGEVWGYTPPRFRDYTTDRNLPSNISSIRLPGYPIVAITSVTIDGVALAPTSYQICDDRWLERIDGNSWPSLQDSPAQDYFVVAYTYGIAIPPMARRAAAAYACEILASWGGDSGCALPPRTQSIVRQGLTTRVLDPDDYVDNGKTGVDQADRFLKAVNPKGYQERAAVLSPDVNWPAHRLR